jgi:hypothetical protein
MLRLLLFLLIVLHAAPSRAEPDDGDALASEHPPIWSVGGHAKYRFLYQTWPEESLFRDVLGPASTDHFFETRLKLSTARARWDFQADYQFIAAHSETLRLEGQLPGSFLPTGEIASDDRRWWNLTYAVGDDDDRSAIVHRLDRLSVGYTTERAAVRFGRQAVSWGNGMVFTPMDVFNPFDPAAVDTEYKSGDDMLYGQYLLENGSDLQGVAVVRRNPVSGDVEGDQSSLAVKYHGFIGLNEYDLLAARHYDDLLLGLGGNLSVGGAVVRGDLTWTGTDRENVLSGVVSVGYSWTWGGTNVSGFLEYFRNGFGQAGGAYSPADLLRNPNLLRRLERGELYTLARNYMAASATLELTPLLLLTPTILVNLDDPSALVQIIARYDLAQDLQLICALNVPLGPPGSEYGGVSSPVKDRYFAAGPSLFGQLAWYF